MLNNTFFRYINSYLNEGSTMNKDVTWPIEDDDDYSSNPNSENSFYQLINKKLDRRKLISGVGIAGTSICFSNLASCTKKPDAKSSLNFKELEKGMDKDFHVAEGYRHDVLIRWGDIV